MMAGNPARRTCAAVLDPAHCQTRTAPCDPVSATFAPLCFALAVGDVTQDHDVEFSDGQVTTAATAAAITAPTNHNRMAI
eukprot:m.275606 g.275606  ORF g.275606 m.275606 type:complete len:80 (+) comp19356_c1_seq5:4851-5090(+)